MATTGKFSFETNAHGNFQANELALREDGNFFEVVVGQSIGVKSHTSLSMRIKKFVGTETFKNEQLPVIKYVSKSDDYKFKYTVKSGSLTATINAGVVAINGTFNIEMTADADSDPAGPKEVRLSNGQFRLEN